MTNRSNLDPYRVRIRYAECDSFGELQAMHWVSLADDALADAMRQQDIDWRRITHPDGPLRLAALAVSVSRAPTYDQQVDLRATVQQATAERVEVGVVAELAHGPTALAEIRLTFSPRTDAQGRARPWPAELDRFR